MQTLMKLELTLRALESTSNACTIYATNTSKSAFAKLVFDPVFFKDYQAYLSDDACKRHCRDEPTVDYNKQTHLRVNTKLLLSYLNHRNHRLQDIQAVLLELQVPGDPSDSSSHQGDSSSQSSEQYCDSEEESWESHLVLRFRLRHKVEKVHRIKLQDTEELFEPRHDPNAKPQHVIMGARELAHIMERIRVAIPKVDGSIAFQFERETMRVYASLEYGQTATEINIPASDLLTYEFTDSTISLSLHIREFAALVELAKRIDGRMKFAVTTAAQPLVIEVCPVTKEGEPIWSMQAWIATAEREPETTTVKRKRREIAVDGPSAVTDQPAEERHKRRRPNPNEAAHDIAQAMSQLRDTPLQPVHNTNDAHYSPPQARPFSLQSNRPVPSPARPVNPFKTGMKESPQPTMPTGNGDHLSSPTKHGSSSPQLISQPRPVRASRAHTPLTRRPLKDTSNCASPPTQDSPSQVDEHSTPMEQPRSAASRNTSIYTNSLPNIVSNEANVPISLGRPNTNSTTHSLSLTSLTEDRIPSVNQSSPLTPLTQDRTTNSASDMKNVNHSAAHTDSLSSSYLTHTSTDPAAMLALLNEEDAVENDVFPASFAHTQMAANNAPANLRYDILNEVMLARLIAEEPEFPPTQPALYASLSPVDYEIGREPQ
ncbi:hypothetical protein CALCODRAFT_546487 [Calocera cornea HHB12733]|uniref:Rad9-domain-containing protein n=1 Tax=Calocera cornea HHB12733 TaxID=1353952 RepID=A0A165EN05_9BASI|nr:hypothetical protein CALCODRAFT_546487 [Calocera cornea HHB12733]